MRPISDHNLQADQALYLRLLDVGVHPDMGQVLDHNLNPCRAREVQLLDMLVPVDMTPVSDHNLQVDQVRYYRLLDDVDRHGVTIILGRNWQAIRPQYSQLLDVAVLVVLLVLDHNWSVLDTPAVEVAKVHYAVPVGQADMALVSKSVPNLPGMGEVQFLLDASAHIVNLVEDMFAQRAVASLPPPFLGPIHIDVAPVAACSEMPHTEVDSAAVSKEGSWRPIRRPHVVQAPVCDGSFPGLEEN
jgi:hypothetical protein